MRQVFALIDCNAFYCSAEIAFNPYLRNKPVVVASNNDGCIVSRTTSAKALGIKMGEPVFKIARQCEQQGIEILSSNYSLYANLSQRVMSVIADHVPNISIYSIDECFADLTGIPNKTELSRDLKATIEKWTGIPVCVGIGQTKTIAKLANRLAKKSKKAGGVVNLDDVPDRVMTAALTQTDVGDVWGVGRKYAERLQGFGVRTALDLSRLEDSWIRHEFGVVLARTATELRGQPVHDFDSEPAPRQSTTCSRSFGEPTGAIEAVAAAVSEFSQIAAARLRSEGLVAGHVQVYAHTSPFRKSEPQGSIGGNVRLNPPTADSRRITSTALQLIRMPRGTDPGCLWAKAGVLLTDLCRADRAPRDLFTVADGSRSKKLMAAIDATNGRFGRGAVRLGCPAEADESWRMKRERLSPSYTTRWEDLPIAKAVD